MDLRRSSKSVLDSILFFQLLVSRWSSLMSFALLPDNFAVLVIFAVAAPAEALQLQLPCMHNISEALAAAKSAPKTQRVWRSQQCEDEFFFDYFIREHAEQHSGGHHTFTYVELGAHDGEGASNTNALYNHLGWRGLLVEATPLMCEKLKKKRPGDVVVCGAVCDASFGGELTFTTSESNLTHQLGHSMVGHALGMGAAPEWSTTMQRYVPTLHNVTVACSSLGHMLNIAGIHKVDLFEHQEFRVLKTVDLWAFRFAVAIIELECPGAKNVMVRQDIHVRNYLSKHGYTYVMRVRGNDIWIDPSVLWAKRGAARAAEAACVIFIGVAFYTLRWFAK